MSGLVVMNLGYFHHHSNKKAVLIHNNMTLMSFTFLLTLTPFRDWLLPHLTLWVSIISTLGSMFCSRSTCTYHVTFQKQTRTTQRNLFSIKGVNWFPFKEVLWQQTPLAICFHYIKITFYIMHKSYFRSLV